MKKIVRVAMQAGLWMIGRDKEGHWVVRDQSGMHGGLFINRKEALRFALLENGRRPQAVMMVPGVLELVISARVRSAVSGSRAGAIG
jgi:hypothetical protein